MSNHPSGEPQIPCYSAVEDLLVIQNNHFQNLGPSPSSKQAQFLSLRLSIPLNTSRYLISFEILVVVSGHAAHAIQLTNQQNYFRTSRDRLRAFAGDMPAHIAFWHPVSRASVPESGADLEGSAAETVYQ